MFDRDLQVFGDTLCSTVSEENVQASLRQMEKSLKDLEIDVKNAQQDKTADPRDKFAEIMSISFLFNLRLWLNLLPVAVMFCASRVLRILQ